MQELDFSDLKENSLEEMKISENKNEIHELSQIQQELHLVKDIQNQIDQLVSQNEESLDIIQDQVNQSRINVNNIKQSTDQSLADTLNLRSNKITLAFSGVLGAFSMIKGFGLTIGATLGGYIGYKAGQISQGNIIEKASN